MVPGGGRLWHNCFVTRNGGNSFTERKGVPCFLHLLLLCYSFFLHFCFYLSSLFCSFSFSLSSVLSLSLLFFFLSLLFSFFFHSVSEYFLFYLSLSLFSFKLYLSFFSVISLSSCFLFYFSLTLYSFVINFLSLCISLSPSLLVYIFLSLSILCLTLTASSLFVSLYNNSPYYLPVSFSSCLSRSTSVIRLLVYVFNLGHFQQWNFAQHHKLFCQSRFKMLQKLFSPPNIAKVF